MPIETIIRDWKFMIVLWLLIATIMVGMLVAMWLNRKYPKETKKLDPIFKGVYIWGFIVIIYLIFIGITGRAKEDINNDIKWILLFGVVLVGWYAYSTYMFNRPKSSEDLWENYVLPRVKHFWNAEPYVGDAYARAYLFSRVVKTNNPAFRQYEDQAEIVEIFLGVVKFATLFRFLATVNKITGEQLELMENPSLEMIRKLTSKDVVSSYQQAVAEYSQPIESEVKQSEQQTVS